MMRNRQLLVMRVFICVLLLFCIVTLRPSHAATITIIPNDGPNEGFNDPTSATPVGGNPGTTVGAQRLNAFQAAAGLWEAALSSGVTIKVVAQFNPLSCSATSGVLGQAGPNSIFRDFSGAPATNTWFVEALANSRAGIDLDTGSNDISATFSSTVGTPGCLETTGWYYGLDGNPPVNRIDFLSVLLHELGHGLGFLSLVSLSTGAKFLGFDDAYMRFLENHDTGESYPTMTNAERVTASKNTGDLHWVGANAVATGSVLTAGRHDPSGHIQMFAPNPQKPGSSVSHWDTALDPNQLMEPSYTEPLHTFDLEVALFQDIGWQLQAPTPCGDGDLDSGEVCDDGNIFNGDGCSSICQIEACFQCAGQPSVCTPDHSCGLNLNHFLLYKANKTPGTTFVPPPPVHLVDQFEDRNYVVQRPLSLGNPANKNNEDPTAPTDVEHLEGYQIKVVQGTPPHTPRSVRVNNQFGRLFVTTIKPDRLLVPSAKSLSSSPPPLPDPSIDHFKCYKVKITPDTSAFQPRQVLVADQFNQPKLFNVKKPTRLCNPVNKNGEDFVDQNAHLLCYQVTKVVGQPPHLKKHVFMNNQFGPGQLDTVREEELCLPSLKTAP